MPKNRSSKHLNDFTDYRLTGDLRISTDATDTQVECYWKLFEPLGEQSVILDDACRDGRVTLPLARHFKQVIGVEGNGLLVEDAKRIGERIRNVQLLNEDVRQLSSPDESFDGVLSAFSSWGVYGEEGDKQSLQEMVRVLKPGGTLVLDWGNAEARLHEIEKNGVYNHNLKRKVVYDLSETPTGEAVVRTSWMDTDMGYHWICQKVGFMDPLIVGLQPGYTSSEIKEMFRSVGMKIVATYGNYDMAPVKLTNSRLITKAVKQMHRPS